MYIRTVGTLFVLPCSLLTIVISLAHERGALREPALLSCLVVLLMCHRPCWDLDYRLAHVCTRVNIATIIMVAPKKRLSGHYRQSQQARFDTAGDNKNHASNN